MPFEKGPEPGSPNDELPEEVEMIEEGFFESIDEMNIPVDILLTKEIDDEGGETGYYTLSAKDYMPRKESVGAAVFDMRSKNPEALKKIVRERIIPLYKTALERLEAIADGRADNLYYWEPVPKPDEEQDEEKK